MIFQTPRPGEPGYFRDPKDYGCQGDIRQRHENIAAMARKLWGKQQSVFAEEVNRDFVGFIANLTFGKRPDNFLHPVPADIFSLAVQRGIELADKPALMVFNAAADEVEPLRVALREGAADAATGLANSDTGYLNRNLNAVEAHHHVRTAFTEALAIEGTLVMFAHDVPSIFNLYLRHTRGRGLHVCHEASFGTPGDMVMHFQREAQTVGEETALGQHRHRVMVPAVLDLLRQAVAVNAGSKHPQYHGAEASLQHLTEGLKAQGKPTELPTPWQRRASFKLGQEAGAYGAHDLK